MKTTLPLRTKLLFSTGDLSTSIPLAILMFFQLYFLTDVAGLRPDYAGWAIGASRLWDAVNDPLFGLLSDRIRTRWGRRRPFLLFFSIPFGLCFMLLWWAPPWESQIARMLTVMVAFMISDTFQTLVTVPFYALMPEIAPQYDQRTNLAGYRMVFNLLASLATAVSAPMIVKAGLNAGWTLQQG